MRFISVDYDINWKNKNCNGKLCRGSIEITHFKITNRHFTNGVPFVLCAKYIVANYFGTIERLLLIHVLF